MKLNLDENIPRLAGERLADLGFDGDVVLDEGMGGRDDTTVWKVAQSEGRMLVTQDLDFSDTRRFAASAHHGVFLVRLSDCEQWQIADYLAAWFSSPDARSWEHGFVVATQHKVRVAGAKKLPME